MLVPTCHKENFQLSLLTWWLKQWLRCQFFRMQLLLPFVSAIGDL